MNITPQQARRRLLQAMAALPLAATLPVRAQQNWPTRIVTLVVPWPAGNPTDAIARTLQPLLTKSLGQTVVIENIAGAGGTLGAGRVFSLPADGHTILMGTPTELILSPLTIPSVRYAPSDFRMVGLFGRVPYILVARANLPQVSLADVVALKNKPGGNPLTVGNIGPGSLIHLIGAQFEKVSGVPVLHVPFKGVPPMVQDLLGGQLDVAFIPVNGSTMGLIEQGKLRSLGITAAAPYPLYPSLKPMAAASQVFAGFSYDVWGGMHVPRTTPEAVQLRLNQLFYEACRDPQVREWARSTGTDLMGPMSLAELDTLYQHDIARYQAIAKATPTGS